LKRAEITSGGLELRFRNVEPSEVRNLLIPEPVSPGMEPVPVDLFSPAKDGDVHAACCLILDGVRR